MENGEGLLPLVLLITFLALGLSISPIISSPNAGNSLIPTPNRKDSIPWSVLPKTVTSLLSLPNPVKSSPSKAFLFPLSGLPTSITLIESTMAGLIPQAF